MATREQKKLLSLCELVRRAGAARDLLSEWKIVQMKKFLGA
jgi:hypothetical protein